MTHHAFMRDAKTAAANHAPPGHSMLFVTDNTGSYSKAAMVHLSEP